MSGSVCAKCWDPGSTIVERLDRNRPGVARARCSCGHTWERKLEPVEDDGWAAHLRERMEGTMGVREIKPDELERELQREWGRFLARMLIVGTVIAPATILACSFALVVGVELALYAVRLLTGAG